MLNKLFGIFKKDDQSADDSDQGVSPQTTAGAPFERIEDASNRQAVAYARHIWENGDADRAQQMCTTIFSNCQKGATNGDLNVARTLRELGNLAGDMNNALLAKQALDEAVTIFTRAGNDLEVGLTLPSLGYLYMSQGHPEEAHAAYKDALSKVEPHSEQGQALAAIKENIKIINQETEALYKRAIDQFGPSQLATDRAGAANALWLLYQFYERENRLTDAEPILRRLIDLLSQDADNELNVAGLQRCLANVYRVTGRHDEAEPLYLQAISVFKAQTPSEAIIPLYEFAELLALKGERAKADRLYKEAIKSAESSGHKGVLHVILCSQAELQSAAGEFEHAQELAQRAVELTEKRESLSWTTLGRVNYLSGQFDAARDCFEKACTIHRLGRGERNAWVAVDSLWLSLANRALGKTAAAEQMEARAVALLKEKIEEENIGIADSVERLANLYRTQEPSVSAELSSILVNLFEKLGFGLRIVGWMQNRLRD